MTTKNFEIEHVLARQLSALVQETAEIMAGGDWGKTIKIEAALYRALAANFQTKANMAERLATSTTERHQPN